ncbi:hypothetical protein AB0J63_04035 [Streptosporangium canum]
MVLEKSIAFRGAILGATRMDGHELSRMDLNGRMPGEQQGERF